MRCFLLVVIGSLINFASAKSIIGFAATGITSHTAAVARVGLELKERGHDFAMLVSAGDVLTQARLAKHPFEEVRQIRYAGPPDLGTVKWLERLDRIPQKVSFDSLCCLSDTDLISAC